VFAETQLFHSYSHHRTEQAAERWCTAIIAQFREWEALRRPWASGTALLAYIEAGGRLNAAIAAERRELLSGRVWTFLEAASWRTGPLSGWPSYGRSGRAPAIQPPSIPKWGNSEFSESG
jgi:hypothetical protein